MMHPSFQEAAQKVLDALKDMPKDELVARLAAQSGGTFSQMAEDMEGFATFLTDDSVDPLNLDPAQVK